jgi:hypothetical protein
MTAIVMIVVSHREHLAAGDPKSAFTPCFFLDYGGKGKTDFP